jgi:hypothetical protein
VNGAQVRAGFRERDAEQVAEALERVFARAEFQPEGEDPLLAFLEKLFDLFSFSGNALSESVLWTLMWIACIALGLFLGWLAARSQFWSRPRGLALDAAAPRARALSPTASERWAELRAQAAAARARGDLALALRLSFFALVVALSGRGDLEFRDAWTNREIVERGRPSPEVHAVLAPWVAELDAKIFGRVKVEEADLDRLASASERLLAAGGGAP